MAKPSIDVEINITNIDECTKKANRLVELLREAQQIINSLSEDSNGNNKKSEYINKNRYSYANRTILSFTKEVKEVRLKQHVSMLLRTGSWIAIGYSNHKTILIRIK